MRPSKLRHATPLLLLWLCAPAAKAQLQLVRWTVDGGGGRASAGALVLGATIGQADAGLHQGSSLRLGGGFWFGGAGAVTGIDDEEQPARLRFALHASHPNPFNPATTIAFDLPELSRVELRIYNLRGELVATLLEGEKPAGRHRLVWHGRDQRGAQVASGIYFLHLSTGAYSARQKLTLVR